MEHFKHLPKFSAVAFIFSSSLIQAEVYNFETEGGIPDDPSCDIYTNPLPACNFNKNLFNQIIDKLEPNDEFYLPNKTFYFNGGIGNWYTDRINEGIKDVVFRFDGTFSLQDNRAFFPLEPDNRGGVQTHNSNLLLEIGPKFLVV